MQKPRARDDGRNGSANKKNGAPALKGFVEDGKPEEAEASTKRSKKT